MHQWISCFCRTCVLTFDLYTRCHLQECSPLFRLPAELRNEIFALATLPYEDKKRKYKETDYYYRPEHHAAYRASTSLLRTCRRAWLETNALPVSQMEHCFWFQSRDRAPPSSFADEERRYAHFYFNLTELNARHVTHVHFFAQMYWLENFEQRWGAPFFRPKARQVGWPTIETKIFTVTIRHTDWWFWERDEPMRLADNWIRQLLQPHGLYQLQEFRLELETVEQRMNQLKPIVDHLCKLQGDYNKRGPEGPWEVMAVAGSPTTTNWSGPVQVGGMTHPIYAGLDRLDYRVVTIVWKPQIFASPGSSESAPIEHEAKAAEEAQWPRNGSLTQYNRYVRYAISQSAFLRDLLSSAW